MPGEAGPLPHQRALLRQQRRHLPAHEFVAHRLPAVGVQLARVADLPRPARGAFVVGGGCPRRRELRPPAAEGVAVVILRAAYRRVRPHRVGHEYRVVWSVDVSVYPEAKQVLVVVGVDAYIYSQETAPRTTEKIADVGRTSE